MDLHFNETVDCIPHMQFKQAIIGITLPLSGKVTGEQFQRRLLAFSCHRAKLADNKELLAVEG
jgi:hypothetical protein